MTDSSSHQLATDEVARLLEVDVQTGLSQEEAQARLHRYGRNVLMPPKGPGALLRFLRQFHAPLVYILLVAAGVTLALGEMVDAAVIAAVVLANAIIGFIQEAKAERAIEALSRMVTTEATVRRGGGTRRIPSAEVVPGDVVLLQSGDRVPADLRLFAVRSLQIDESALTGESAPVAKHPSTVALDTILAERRNLAFAGTLVTYGRGEGLVWATGDRTETGRISWLISEATDLSTPLTKKIAEFSRLLLLIILGLAAATFAAGLWHGRPVVETFMAAVALAVGAIPEGLPAAVTITLAIGVARMVRRRAIIRRLPAVETLGSTTVICSDKTGTLTQNQMTVREIFAGGVAYAVSGSGYEPRGEFLLNERRADLSQNTALLECLRAGVLCNDSQLILSENRWSAQGDPTEAALIVAAEKAGLLYAELTQILPRLDVIPFESEHQFMATLHSASDEGGRLIYKKGAVERILGRCTSALSAAGGEAPLDRDSLHDAARRMAADGLRVLAFARRTPPGDQRELEHGHVAGGLTFLGLQGMMDPPRPEAIASVRRCRSAGIEVKMITGDHALTAGAVARQLGLRNPGGEGELMALTGRELETLSEEALQEAAAKASVFARVAPEQKLRLVQALQARGQIVAMTGDGVNDAPALKQADIGIAMGITGTDVAKGAADMLLTDDNFASIEAAVEEGRSVFDNLSKFIVWTLPTNVGEGLVILTAVFLGATLPILPVQLLWVNMATAVLIGLTLVFEPKGSDLMRRPPRDPRQPILTWSLTMRTALVSLILQIGAYGLFYWEQRAHGAGLAEARTIVVNVIVVVEIFYLLNCRSLTKPAPPTGIFANPWMIGGISLMVVAQLAFTYLPWMNLLFHTAPITGESWGSIILVGLATYAAVEIEKFLRLRFARQNDGSA